MGEFEAIHKTGLLVQAAEVTAEVDDLVLCFEVFARYGLNCNKYVTKVYLNDTHIRIAFFMSHNPTITCGICQFKSIVHCNKLTPMI